jgi:hypothetical protein
LGELRRYKITGKNEKPSELKKIDSPEMGSKRKSVIQFRICL